MTLIEQYRQISQAMDSLRNIKSDLWDKIVKDYSTAIFLVERDYRVLASLDKIQTVMLYHKKTGKSIKESKDYIEMIMKQ